MFEQVNQMFFQQYDYLNFETTKPTRKKLGRIDSKVEFNSIEAARAENYDFLETIF